MGFAAAAVRSLKRRLDRLRRDVSVTRDENTYLLSDGDFSWHLPHDDVEKFLFCKTFTDVYDRYVTRLGPGDTLLKVGAATGEDLVPAARRLGEDGRAYAIEADPDNCRCLRKNLALHGVDNTRVDQYAVAAESDDEIDFSKHRTSHTTHRVSEAPLIQDETEYDTLSLPTITVDDYCRNLGITRLDMLSVTVNRYEAAILRGASETLETTRFAVVPENDTEVGDTSSLLEDSGFERISEGHGGSLFENTSL